MFCYQCGKSVTNHNNFCSNCGTTIIKTTKDKSIQKENPNSKINKCPNCFSSFENTEGEYCGICGFRIIENDNEINIENKHKQKIIHKNEKEDIQVCKVKSTKSKKKKLFKFRLKYIFIALIVLVTASIIFGISVAIKNSNIVMIDTGGVHTVGLKSNGTVVISGGYISPDYGICDVDDWEDIVSISAGGFHTVGLKSDGTVVAVGNNTEGQCNVEDWKDIVAVVAGSEHTVGLKSDGTLIYTGDIYQSDGDINDWENISALSAGGIMASGIQKDGKVKTTSPNVISSMSESKDLFSSSKITSIVCGYINVAYLKDDGTVVILGPEDNNLGEAENWKDIIQISMKFNHIVGLKKDGTVVATGENEFGQCDVEKWKDIVYVSTGLKHTVGVTKEGDLVSVGSNVNGARTIKSWRCKLEDFKKLPNTLKNNTENVFEKGLGSIPITSELEEFFNNEQEQETISKDIIEEKGFEVKGDNIALFRNNDSLKYNSKVQYKYNSIHNSRLVDINYSDYLVKLIYYFNNAWINYVNYGDREVFDYVQTGSKAYNNVSKFNTKNVTEKFQLVEIGDVRFDDENEVVYMWVHEKIEKVKNGKKEIKEYYWIYRLTHEGTLPLIDSYFKDPMHQ